MKIVLIGEGALGSSLSNHLDKKQVEYTWFRKSKTGRYFEKQDIQNENTIYLSAIPESSLKKLFSLFPVQNNYYIHFSGSLGFDVFPSDQKSKKAILHPMYSFPDRSEIIDIENLCFTFQGDKTDTVFLSGLLKIKLLPLKLKNPVLYHTMGVIAGNFQNALYQIALDLGKENGLSEKEIKQILLPLSYNTLKNIEKFNLNGSLSGPVKREEWDLIARQEKEIQKIDEEYGRIYQLMTDVLKNKILRK